MIKGFLYEAASAVIITTSDKISFICQEFIEKFHYFVNIFVL